MGISAPLLPKLGKYDVRVAPVCICIRQIDLRLTHLPVGSECPSMHMHMHTICICSGSQTFWDVDVVYGANHLVTTTFV